MKDDQKDQNSGEVGKEHRAIPSSESLKTSESKAAPSYLAQMFDRRARGLLRRDMEHDIETVMQSCGKGEE